MILKNRQDWKIIRDYSIGWTVAFVFLSIVRGVGTIEMGSVQFEFHTSILVSLIFGIFFGSISGYVRIVTEERAYRRMSIQRLLALRFGFAVVFLTVLILVSYVMCRLFFGVTIGLMEFAFEPGSLAIYFYILSVDVFMVMLRQVNLMLGDNNLLKLLKGEFYTPREEERIFMFLDLQSSTQLAEKLGHIRYSMLIQDCFNDLGVVTENEADIYQYVGDEVILTWKLRQGLKNQNCLDAYFNFRRKLTEKQRYYLQKYNCAPFFKAGMNSGVVTVTEVGKYKKEIAYHGDTINTAARIQDKCNEFNQELLISKCLRDQLNGNRYRFDQLGGVVLRGKEKEVPMYAVVKA